ncbi:MAG: hypothetical protein V4492_02505, partial [Chlamydiota bacterium]
TQVGDITRERDDLNTQVGDLTRERDDLNARVGGLNTQVGDLTRERDDLNARIGGLNTQVGDLTRERDDLNARIGDITRERDTLDTRVGELTTTLNAAEARAQSEETRANSLAQELEIMRASNELLLKQTSELDTLRAQLEAAQVKVKELAAEMEERFSTIGDGPVIDSPVVGGNSEELAQLQEDYEKRLDGINQQLLQQTQRNAQLSQEKEENTAVIDSLRSEVARERELNGEL